MEGTPELSGELGLFNKLGDLYLKSGDVPAAVEQYERAVGLYTEQGFPNNAIALCNKVLRNAPGRTHMYLKLAKLMMARGFVAEAKQNLLEYADRMQKAGAVEEAFQALKEFADLSPASEEIRLMLAEQLKRAARTDEAREQLAKLYHELRSGEDTPRKRSTMERMKAIDPEYDLDAAPAPRARSRQPKTSDIVFLDLTDEASLISATDTDSVEVEPEPIDIERTALDDGTEPMEVSAPPADLPIERASVEISATDLRAAMDDAEDVAGLETSGSFETLDEPAESDAELEELEIETTALSDSIEAPDIDALEIEAMVPGAADAVDTAEPDVVETGEVGEAVEDWSADKDEVPEGGDLPLLEVAADSEDAGELIDFSEDIDIGEIGDEAGIEVPALDIDFGEVEEVGGVAEEGEPVADMPVLEVDEAAEEVARAAADEATETAIADAVDDGGLILAEAEFDTVEEIGPPDIDALEAKVLDDPDDPESHRQLAEGLIELGQRERGLEELEIALSQYEGAGDRGAVQSTNEEILRLEPNSIEHHRRRVEFLLADGDSSQVVGAYMELADALVRSGALESAQRVYERVLEQDPDNERARAAMDTLEPFDIGEPDLSGVAAADDSVESADSGGVAAVEPEAESQPEFVPEAEPEPELQTAAAESPATASDDFVDLGALILDEEGPKDTRIRIDHAVENTEEQQDFQDMLSEFKKGIDANVDIDDSQAHYDLGVAFKEMGLLDEAISEFQKALRGADGRMRTAEALGLCFFEKGQYAVAATVLRRAIESEAGADEQKIGLLYWLGRCEEQQGHPEPALGYYRRIFAIDIDFQDVKERVQTLAEASS
ncbi:MAG: tetratricopeptide repeat protein [Gemmatimonadales bacterium]